MDKNIILLWNNYSNERKLWLWIEIYRNIVPESDNYFFESLDHVIYFETKVNLAKYLSIHVPKISRKYDQIPMQQQQMISNVIQYTFDLRLFHIVGPAEWLIPCCF